MMTKIIKILDVIASNKELEAFEKKVLDKIIPPKVVKEPSVEVPESTDVHNASEVDV